MKKSLKQAIWLSAATTMLCVSGVFASCSTKEEATTVEVPTLTSATYTGEKQTASVAENEAYTVSVNDGGTDVGNYNVVLTLTDTTKYKWETPDEDNAANKTLTFQIVQATNEIISLTMEGWTYGEAANTPTGEAKFGTIVYTYANSVDGTYTAEQPSEVGEYYVKASVEGTTNYTAAEKTVAFTIGKQKAEYTAPTANTLTYTGEAQALVKEGTATGGTIQYKLGADGEYSETIPTATNAGEYTVYYKVVGDANHSDTEDASLTITIAKANATLTAPTANALIYTGAAQALVNAGTATGGTMQYKLGADGTYSDAIPTAMNAGAYTVYYKVVGDANHSDTEEASLTITIAKANATLTAPTANALTYTGEAQALVNAGTATGGTMQYKLGADGEYSDAIPTAMNAGEYTVYYKVVGDANHNDVAEANLTITIAKAANAITTPATMPEVYCGDDLTTKTFAFTTTSGDAVTLQFSADGSTYSNTLSVKKGTYYVKATLAATANYEAAADVTATFAVEHKLGEATTVKGASVKACTCGEYTEVSGTTDKQQTALAVSVTSGTASATAGTLDLTAYYTGSGTATITVGGNDYSATMTNGKVSLTSLPATLWGEQTLAVSFTADTCKINVNVPMLLVTKEIASQSDLQSISAIEKALSGGGYYLFTDNVNLTTPIYSSSYDYTIGTTTTPFVGTLDGAGYTLDGITMQGNWDSDFGFIRLLGKGGTLKNIAFTNVTVKNKGTLVSRTASDCIIENVYVQYSTIDWTNQGYTATFGNSAGYGKVTMTNVVVNLNSLAIIQSGTVHSSIRLLGWFYDSSVLTNVAVIGVQSQYSDCIIGTAGSNSANVTDKVYIAYTNGTTNGKTIPSTNWDTTYWTASEGSLPTFNGITVNKTADFTTSATTIEIGKSATFKVAENCILVLGDNASGIATLSDGTITVSADAKAGATFTIYAYNLFDYANPMTVTVAVIEGVVTLETTQNVNLNVALTDGTAAASGTITLDLASAYTGSASGVTVSLNGTTLTTSATITDGKLSFTASTLSPSLYGNATLAIASSGALNVLAPVFILTKQINTTADLQSIGTIAEALKGDGYYQLGATITAGAVYTTSVDYRIGTTDNPFVGTLDGNGYSIDGMIIANNSTMGGWIERMNFGATMKNITFTNLCLGGNCALVYAGTGGTFENVTVQYGAFGSDTSGTFNSGWLWGQETTFFCPAGAAFGSNQSTDYCKVIMKNVTVDYTKSQDFNSLAKKAYLKMLGRFSVGIANDGSIQGTSEFTNVKILGVNKENYENSIVGDKYGGSHAGATFGIYVEYTDGTNNGITLTE